MKDLSQIVQSLAVATDPFLLVDANSNVIWWNSAAISNFSIRKDAKELSLGEIFQEDMVREILACEHFAICPVRTLKINTNTLPLTALVTCLGSIDPDNDIFVIAFKPSAFLNQSLFHRGDSPSTLAHDLKNPLGAIFGYSDALIETPIGQGLHEKQKDILRRVRSTAARSIELVRNIQQLSQLHTPNSNQTRKSLAIDLNATVESVIHHTFRDNLDQPKVVVELNGKPLLVALDRIALDRVITNLYSNALKFTPLDGTIIIKTWSEHDRALQQNKACFSITNSKPIIPHDELSQLFQRHYRGSTSRGISGSGLGLFIVQQLVTNAGGAVTAESAQEQGTTFIVKLPKSQ
jgi:signal transduction histidine kinase